MVFVLRMSFYVVCYESVPSFLIHFTAGCLSTELRRVESYGFNITVQNRTRIYVTMYKACVLN